MTHIIVHDDAYEGWVFHHRHPTQGIRFTNGEREIRSHFKGIDILQPRPATRAELSLVHTQSYISQVRHGHVCDEWAGRRPDLAELATLFAGGTLVALEALIDGADTAIHLPGAKHHAQADHSSGFCVFADFAIAALTATALGYRVAILDIDAHHGDGTENLTMSDPNVLTFSIHEDGIFPGTGHRDFPTLNVYNQPLGFGSGPKELHDGITRFLSVAQPFDPDLLFVAGGADGHMTDPLSSLRYTFRSYRSSMDRVRLGLPNVPILFGGAGGYQPHRGTPISWRAMVQGLTGL